MYRYFFLCCCYYFVHTNKQDQNKDEKKYDIQACERDNLIKGDNSKKYEFLFFAIFSIPWLHIYEK